VVFVVVHDALFASGQLAKGETVLVTAAPSGVGVTALVLAKYLGARVIGTSRSAEKLEKLKPHGLDVGVVTGSAGFGAAIAPVIGENGVDMVVDNIGGGAQSAAAPPQKQAEAMKVTIWGRAGARLM
jgi:NADPH2:quinone reductase